LGADLIFTTVVGFAAAFCTTFALVPQVYRTWTTRSTTDVSMGWISVLALGTFLWFVYGLMISDVPLITANGISFLLAATILMLKLRYG
jgi:MtN3 and saliva related transmembrane protein